MNLTTLKQHLELAEEHLAAVRRHIARQRRIILDLEGAGQDTTEVRQLLAEFAKVSPESLQLWVDVGGGAIRMRPA